MKKILPMQKDFKRIIGKQKFAPCKYVSSKYNFLHVNLDNTFLVFNSFSGILAVLSKEQYDALNNDYCLLDNNASGDLVELVCERLLVPENNDEVNDYMQLYETVNYLFPAKSVNSYTVLTTTGCNARCFYCFEQGFRSETMLRSTAETVADYMIKNAYGKKISIHWFGGEPLCNTMAIDIICEKLISAGVAFSSSMTSNAYAFTKQIIEKASSLWNLDFVQVTLDGLHDEHNRRKNFITSTPDPFNQTIINIHDLIEAGIAVSVRLNFDADNLTQIPDLVDYLAKEFCDKKRISLYPVALFEDCNSWNPNRTASEQLSLINEQTRLCQYIRERFFLSEKNVCRGFSRNHCGANNPEHRTINPNGTFSVCHNFSDSLVYGSVFDGITFKEEYEKWTTNKRVREKCKDCKWLPECTAFDMCPVKKTYCQVDYENQICNKITRIYKNWSKMPENNQ